MSPGKIIRNGLYFGIAAGVGAAVLGPVFWRAARPVAKAALKGTAEGFAAAQVAGAHIVEEFEDLIAEVRHELAEARGATAEPAPTGPVPDPAPAPAPAPVVDDV